MAKSFLSSSNHEGAICDSQKEHTIPLITQKYTPRIWCIHTREMEETNYYIKSGIIIFISLYMIGIIAYFMTWWTKYADGGRESLMEDNFQEAMIIIPIMSFICSILAIFVSILFPKKCGNCLPSGSDDPSEKQNLIGHLTVDGFYEEFDQDLNKRNFHLVGVMDEDTPSFHAVAAAR